MKVYAWLIDLLIERFTIKVYAWLVDFAHFREKCPTGIISEWMQKVTWQNGIIHYNVVKCRKMKKEKMVSGRKRKFVDWNFWAELHSSLSQWQMTPSIVWWQPDCLYPGRPQDRTTRPFVVTILAQVSIFEWLPRQATTRRCWFTLEWANSSDHFKVQSFIYSAWISLQNNWNFD